MSALDIVNISGYKFKTLEGIPELREDLRSYLRSKGVKGSILLADEGANIFLAATRDLIDDARAYIAKTPIGDIDFKESVSNRQPFSRMLVKIKNEIVTMGQPQIKPALHPAPMVSAETLKQWYDEGRDMIVLDTRNDYEYHLGHFKDAMLLPLKSFREFPALVRELDLPKDTLIVTYCTGGIRCEKGAPFMVQEGFTNLYQLEGGILKYFELVGKEHYVGECFVFDHRVALDADLHETATQQCFVCREPVTVEQQALPEYVVGTSCPSCYKVAE